MGNKKWKFEGHGGQHGRSLTGLVRLLEGDNGENVTEAIFKERMRVFQDRTKIEENNSI